MYGLVLSLVLGFTPAAFAAGGRWSDAKITSLKSSTKFKRKIPLNIIVLKDGWWTKEVAVSEIRKMENTYKACEVSFSPIKIAEARYSKGPSFAANDDQEIITSQPFFASRPLVFFAQTETSNSNLRAAYAKRAGLGLAPELTDVVVYFELGYRLEPTGRQENGVQLAHEMAHVLFDEPHNKNPGNILCGSYECMGHEFSEAQCAKLH